MRNEQQRLQLERYCSIFRHTRRGNTALHPPKTKQATDSASKRSCSGSWDVGKTASKHVLTPPTQTCKSIATSTSAGPPEPASSPPSTSLSSPESWVTSAGSGMLVSPSHLLSYEPNIISSIRAPGTSEQSAGEISSPSAKRGRPAEGKCTYLDEKGASKTDTKQAVRGGYTTEPFLGCKIRMMCFALVTVDMLSLPEADKSRIHKSLPLPQ